MPGQKLVVTPHVSIGKASELALIAGPCVLEDLDTALKIAETCLSICRRLGLPYIFKASFDKANRSSIDSYRGPGLEPGLAMLAAVKDTFAIPITTDIHAPEQAGIVSEVADIIQIPAFLCRQTDLLVAAGRSGRVVNIKKGQFMAPGDMGTLVDKVASTGNQRILLTERGTTFGYNNLVVDFRSLPLLAMTGCPVVFDATHSVQLPAGRGKISGGDRTMIPTLAAAAVAAGADAIFMEVHPEPEKALCDGANSLPLAELEPLLARLKNLKQAAWN